MAIRLPDGATVFLATGYGADKAVSAISNANPAVATAASHGIANGAFFELKTSWQKISERIFKATNVASGTLEIAGSNTTDTSRFPVGGGSGSVREITGWTQVTQILGFATNGGDQQYWTGSFMEDDFERQLPTVTSSQSIELEIGDDPSLAGYKALKDAGEARALRALRVNLPDGSVLLYNGIVSFNETPTMTKGQVMTVKATFSLQGRPVRYEA